MATLKKDEDVRELVFDSLRRALSRSKFSIPDLRQLVDRLLKRLENDLDSCLWSPEQGEQSTEQAATVLADFLNQLDRIDSDEEDQEPIEIESPNAPDRPPRTART